MDFRRSKQSHLSLIIGEPSVMTQKAWRKAMSDYTGTHLTNHFMLANAMEISPCCNHDDVI